MFDVAFDFVFGKDRTLTVERFSANGSSFAIVQRESSGPLLIMNGGAADAKIETRELKPGERWEKVDPDMTVSNEGSTSAPSVGFTPT